MSHSFAKPRIDRQQLERALDCDTARLIEQVAAAARQEGRAIYLVGGVVRDLLLGLPNEDIDFALESDTRSFADSLVTRYGGQTRAHQPFGTATWLLDSEAARRLGSPLSALPDHIDFARARREQYAQAAALPTVRPGNIQDDMWRRDFSINALALDLSDGQLVDYCGGLADLARRQIRVLHARSFVDDPTRILRALRLATRLDFTIEPETDAWMRAALPLLRQVTGSRLRNEIDLALQEEQGSAVIARFAELGALQAMQPDWILDKDFADPFERALAASPPWDEEPAERGAMGWALLLAPLGAEKSAAIASRFDQDKSTFRLTVACAEILALAETLNDAALKPSQVLKLLENLPDDAIAVGWRMLPANSLARENLAQFANCWRHLRPMTSGDDLKQLGLPPGPEYRRILGRLRDSWLDGEVSSAEEEVRLLNELLEAQNEARARLL